MRPTCRFWQTALVIAMVMMVAMSVVAHADAPTTGDIKITTGTVKGSTYTAYQVLELSMNEAETAYAYSIKSNSQFYTYINGKTEWFTLTAIDVSDDVTTYQVVPKTAFNDTAAATMASDLSGLTLTGGNTSSAASDDGATVTITGLPLGYYFVTTTTGTVCSLDTNNSSVAIQDKNAKPSIKKEVQEDRDNEWGKKNDAEIGQVVNYKTTVTAQKGAKKYIVHDTMTTGLTYNDDAVVSTPSGLIKGNDADTGDYHVVKNSAQSFVVYFHQSYLDRINTSTDIVITYSATVNENAVVNKPENAAKTNGNDNDTYLVYGESSDHETEHDWTRTYVWDVDVFKYTGTNTPLAGAKFVISKDNVASFDDAASITNKLKFTNITVTGGTPTYRLDTNGSVTEITTDATGKFKLVGFDENNTKSGDNVYYLYETAAPAGYNKVTTATAITVIAADVAGSDRTTSQTIENEHTFTPSGNASGNAAVDVLNNSGSELPSTGGIGTTIFYVIGAILVLGAGILLVTRRRVSAN